MAEIGIVSRQERKERTRQAILDSALALSADTGLASISLRQVARDVGIVPTGFYRHFDSIEQLGLVLVDDSFVLLRTMLRDVRGGTTLEGVIPGSVEVLIRHVRAQEAHFGFIARERNGGSGVVRSAIRHELELCEQELATDISRIAGTEAWSPEDLSILSEMIVGTMVGVVDRLLDTPRRADPEIAHVARTQLRMLVVGALGWQSRSPD